MKNLYRETFDEVHASDTLRQEVWSMTKQEQNTPKRRRIPAAALAAAVLVLALTGTTLAASGFVPGSIKNWFIQQWAETSGGEGISAEQAALFDRLTQEVGVSDTCGGVTVTLDSITCGDSALWLLLKVSGDIDAVQGGEDAPGYYFMADVEFSEDPDREDTPGGIGIDYPFSGISEDGVQTMLMRYTINLTGTDSLLDGYEAELHLDALMYGHSVAQEGEWVLPFTIEPSEREVLTLESAAVPARDHGNKSRAVTAELRNIRVSATGIRFTQTAEQQMFYPDLEGVVLADGTEVPDAGGGSRWTGEVYTGEWDSNYYWELPVDLSQVVGVRFGDTVIPLK